MLSEIVSRYAKCNSINEVATDSNYKNIQSELNKLLNNVDQKIRVIESALLYKNIPFDFNWREYLDINSDLRHHISDEYNAKLNYDLYGFYENRFYKKSQLRNINTFIYCGGKCGGVTLRNTFQQKHIPCIHSHSNQEFNVNYIGCGGIHELIKRNMGLHKTIYVIDSYRLPIERKMSSFFQNISIDIPDYKSKTIDELITHFNHQYIYNVDPTQNNEDYHPIDEMIEYLGISQNINFDFNKFYGVCKYQNIVFIKLRFQNIDKWEGILSGITGRSLSLCCDNLSKNKPYVNLYEQFKRKYKVPKSYLENLSKNSIFIKYNTPNEQTEYINYWTTRSS